jgi:hypothetical protein
MEALQSSSLDIEASAKAMLSALMVGSRLVRKFKKKKIPTGDKPAANEGNAPQATGKLAASASVGVQTIPAELSSDEPRIRTGEEGGPADFLREELRHAQAVLNDSLAGQERLAAVEKRLVRRPPLRACWRPF